MAYKIIDIQGIGEAYAPKLIAIGIKTPEELLEACLTPSARKKVAEETGISGKLILKYGLIMQIYSESAVSALSMQNCLKQPVLIPLKS